MIFFFFTEKTFASPCFSKDQDGSSSLYFFVGERGGLVGEEGLVGSLILGLGHTSLLFRASI